MIISFIDIVKEKLWEIIRKIPIDFNILEILWIKGNLIIGIEESKGLIIKTYL
jgi:hypothetical protein